MNFEDMKTIQIFLGGGVELLHGSDKGFKGYRTEVIDPAISQLNSNKHAKCFFIAKDYTDLTSNVEQGSHQEVYNKYIEQDSHIAIFIIDGEIGNITMQEIDAAVASTRKKHHPIVYIYGKNVNNEDAILKYLNQKGVYYTHFYDDRDLASKIKEHLRDASEKIDSNSYVLRWIIAGVLVLLLLFSLMFQQEILPLFKTAPKVKTSFDDKLNMALRGKFGGDQSGAKLRLQDGRGRYVYAYEDNLFERDVVVERYDKNTDSLIINAYFKGTRTYVGQFRGILIVADEEKTYSGTFFNYKGDSTDFKFR